MTFDQIYLTIDSDFKPKRRTVYHLGVILKQIIELSKNQRFNILEENKDSRLRLIEQNTIVARLILESQTIKASEDGHYYSMSEGIERAIANIKTFKILSYTPPSEDSRIFYIQIAGALNGLKEYFIHSLRQGLIASRKKRIEDYLIKLKLKAQKLNFLRAELISMKQSKNTWDPTEYERLSEYLELEIEKWILMEDIKENTSEFSSNEELYNFINELIEDKFNHNIIFDEGYRVFWRDVKCINSPKHEPEIHHYIKTILKPYCDLRNVNIVRENVVANGRIDLAFVYLNYTVCMEVKKANHQDVEKAMKTQLTEYMKGEKTEYGIYLILWYKNNVGYSNPSKYNSLDELIKSIEIPDNDFIYKIKGIDCNKPISPSKNQNER